MAKYLVTERGVNTVGTFLGIRPEIKMSAQELIDFRSNWGNIRSRYSAIERDIQEQNYASGGYDSIILKEGTWLLVPDEKIKRETLYKEPPAVVRSTDSKGFLADQLRALLRDPNYIKRDKLRNNQGEIISDNNDVSVFMWIRSLSPADSSSEGSWVNVSAFIQSLNTNVAKDGGSFTMNLAPVIIQPDPTQRWALADVITHNTGNVVDDYVSQGQVTEGEKRGSFFFHQAVQQNDLIYIRFEKLKRDSKDFTDKRVLTPFDIPGNTYDMIGLVNTSTISTSNNNASITVSGQDLSKIMTNDNSYFFPEQFAGDLFINNPNGILAQRNKVEAFLDVLKTYTLKSVEVSVKFIFNKFAGIGWVPDSVFSGYGSNLIRGKFSIKSKAGYGAAEEIGPFTPETRKGVWRIIDLVFDKTSTSRVLADASIAIEENTVMASIQKYCQEPWIEVFGDTYGDRYVLVIRKPPFDKLGCTSMVYGDVDTEAQPDTATNNPLRATVREIFGDQEPVESPVGDTTLTINEADVISDNLGYETRAYSWYQITPQGLLMGQGDQSTTLAYMPLVAFDEYAEVFGANSLSIVNQYIPFEFISGEKEKIKFVEGQAFLDLQYMIQTTAHLPFTRKGSITIHGDRRFKRGTYLYYKPTREVFYIDSVSNNRNINTSNNQRSTTLQVTRGMVEPFIKGVNVRLGDDLVKVSYFDIIDTDIPPGASFDDRSFLKKWQVNTGIFNFFLQRRQWALAD